MNALLVYPQFQDTFWSFRHALKFVHKRAALPPLGLLTVAAMLPTAWRLRVVDLNVRPLGEADLAWADLVMISAMIAQRASTVDVIDRCRRAGKTIVAGGPLFTIEPARFPDVDHLVLNEAEATLPEFLSDFAAGRARHSYRSGRLPSLDETPAPRWDLIDLRRYASMCVQYSRGCPFDCEFCSVTAMFGHRPRVKSSGQIVAELNALGARGWRGPVFFVDDNFIGNRRSLRDDLLPALIQWQQGRKAFNLYTEASINLADDAPLMRMMVEAGFDQVFIGIETPDELALAECNKRQNCGRNLVDDVKRIQRAGLQVQGGFIVGFDHDTPGIFQRQLELIQRSGIVTAMVGMLQAVPGTRLHARLSREGRLLDDASGDNSDGTMNFLPPMGRDAMERGYRWLVGRVYAPRAYYARIRTLLREYRPRRRRSRGGRWRDLVAFAHACVRLGVVGRERFQFWGLLAWTSFRRPRLLPLAITLSIYGHHFRLCSRGR